MSFCTLSVVHSGEWHPRWRIESTRKIRASLVNGRVSLQSTLSTVFSSRCASVLYGSRVRSIVQFSMPMNWWWRWCFKNHFERNGNQILLDLSFLQIFNQNWFLSHLALPGRWCVMVRLIFYPLPFILRFLSSVNRLFLFLKWNTIKGENFASFRFHSAFI